MTKEQKELLRKVFYEMSPHGVMFSYNNNELLKAEGIVRDIVYFKGYNYQTEGDECYADIIDCKPYLRSLSSMTEDEKSELLQLMGRGTDIERVDFYISHHFDYRCLIPMGLALEAPKDMYKI